MSKPKKVTSKRIAKVAGKLLPSKRIKKRIKGPIASALSQREN